MKEKTKLTVLNFIKTLPTLPSRYCRKDSTRVYLPQEFKNVCNLYEIYKISNIGLGMDVVSERVFRSILSKKFNIGFHVPRKGKCPKCLRYKRTDITNETIRQAELEHTTEKLHSYNRFKAHQNIHKSNPETLCVNFDLQKALNTPNGKSVHLYFSHKLSVYNLTFYENGTHDVFCFLWDEVNGKRCTNEISSILQRYIIMVDRRESIKSLLLYCDCCPMKNRNQAILAMIHATLQNCKFLETIQINFLLTGHTHMLVDSVHAVVEKNIKNIIIWAPSQWYTVFATARQDPRPYNVEYLTFKDFNNWDVIGDKYFKENITDIISKIHICTFKKNDPNKIHTKNSMDHQAPNFEIEVQTEIETSPSGCYETLIPISKQKYDDLNKLCMNNVVPKLFHHEYTSIPTDSNVTDTLADTDLEDEDFET